jgi:hypothetical protein
VIDVGSRFRVGSAFSDLILDEISRGIGTSQILGVVRLKGLYAVARLL